MSPVSTEGLEEQTPSAVETAEPAAEPLPAVAALQDSVRNAQQRAENELAKLVERIQSAESERHAAELVEAAKAADIRLEQAVAEARAAGNAEAAQVREELNRELRELRDNAQVDMTAAVERALKEQAENHAADLARVQDDLERQHTDSLERVGTAVLDSLERVTERIITTG